MNCVNFSEIKESICEWMETSFYEDFSDPEFLPTAFKVDEYLRETSGEDKN